MWHDARKREKAIQRQFNEHKKRAEKRREEDRVDPSSLLQINGLKAKLYLDSNVYKQAARSLVEWQGDSSITIDRFDVRATLSSIPVEDPKSSSKHSSVTTKHGKKSDKIKHSTVLDGELEEEMKIYLRYERFRVLIHNDLNKISEELRLKLVVKNDNNSEAKLRKLRYNKFGTSGETSLTYSNNIRQSNQFDSRRKITGPNYTSVPPPGAIIDSTNVNQKADDTPDFDEFLEFDKLDYLPEDYCFDEKRIKEVAKKYGFTSRELTFFIENDNSDCSVSEIILGLTEIHVKQRVEDENSNMVYGPALPPELIQATTGSPRKSPDDTQVQQRSPRALDDIPLRKHSRGQQDAETPPETEQLSDHSNDARLARMIKPAKEMTCAQSNPDNGSNLIKVDESSDKSRPLLNSAPKYDDKMRSENEPRRASTPLAYKRNCRSERSLSRDRKSTHYSYTKYHKSSSHHRKHKRSRMHSSGSSTSSITSRSSHSPRRRRHETSSKFSKRKRYESSKR